MMGGLIASVLSPHPPRMPLASGTRAGAQQSEALISERWQGLISGSEAMGAALRSLQPDLFVINSAHWVTSFDWFATCQDPHRGICVADEAPNLIPGLEYQFKGDPKFAKAFVEIARRHQV